MPKRYYKIINKDEFQGKILATLKRTINELEKATNLGSDKCIHMNGYILIKTDLNTPLGVTVKSPDASVVKLKDIPEEYKSVFEELVQKYKLKSKEISELLSDLKKAKAEQHELEKQIEIIKEKAKDISENRDIKKTIKDFNDYTDKFLASLKGIRNLNSDSKVGIKEKLEKVTDEIINTYTYLD